MSNANPQDKSKVGGIVLVVIALVALYTCTSGNESQTIIKPLQIATAKDLAQAFAENEVAAKDRYVDAPLQMTGQVTQISEGSGGASLLYLATSGGDYIVAKFNPSERETAATIRAGDQITANCEKTMYVLGYVTPQGCVFASKK